jgi:uncharacterized membrane protein YuzA (DUF378 family)
MSEPRKTKKNIITLWVSSGSDLTSVQRIGYTLFSLFVLAVGLIFLQSCLESWKDGHSSDVLLWGLCSFILVLVGVCGLINVLRFQKQRERD